MKNTFLIIILVQFQLVVFSQEKVIQLYKGAAPGSENWTYSERSDSSLMPLVYNVSQPTLTAYLPDPKIANGTAIILCPGGGFFILDMKNASVDVAKWLNEKGITVFLLKYRLAEIFTDKPVQEVYSHISKGDLEEKTKSVIPLAINDGKEALKYVRAHAAEYSISPSHIGIIGFSAGAAVSEATAIYYAPETRPDFVAAFYGALPSAFDGPVPADAPPMFLAAASDDQFGAHANTVALYSKWIAAKRAAELHVYAKGGHGFGMKKQNIPVDNWTERFTDWLTMNGWLDKKK